MTAIDTHIHLFDTNRPEGVPWPPKNDAVLYKPALPARYRSLAEPLGVVGAIEVEASPWLEDNQWVLDQAAHNTIIVGTVGDLEPGHKDFRDQLERFHRNPLFRGIRYGNLWGRDLGARLAEPAFIADLKFLAAAGLSLDTANPNPALVAAAVRATDHVPELRVVMDHLANLDPPTGDPALREYEKNLQRLAERPQVFVKISQVLQRKNGTVEHSLSAHREKLDRLWELFGEERLMYGSDWPNSDPHATYAEVLALAQAFIETKPQAAQEKFFWRNSLACYRWVKRDKRQPG